MPLGKIILICQCLGVHRAGITKKCRAGPVKSD